MEHILFIKERFHVGGINNAENLQDAMCPEEMTRVCIGLAEAENERDMLRLLEEHRKELLTRIHGYQKALDCLDYLMFQTKKHRKQEEL